MSTRRTSPPPVSPGNISDAITNISVTSTRSRNQENCRDEYWKHFRGAGACDFPCDPETPPDSQSLFWIPSLQPQAIRLAAADHKDGETEPIVTLAHLDDVDLRQADDGWHGLWQVDGVTHQFWFPDAALDKAAFYVFRLAPDRFFDLRAHAARRLWRSLNGRTPGPDFRRMPSQLRQFHILSLRALDARLHGESYRAIAEILLGFRGDKTDWENDPRRNRVRRLVTHGLAMMKGGYRPLLHYPLKPRHK